MQEFYVDSVPGLNALCEQLRGSEWLAVDTEFMREKSYFPQLCLLQVSNGHLAASVDPLAIDDLAPLLDILYDPATVKIFHSGHQDLEIFYLLRQSLPVPLFDTQLAATLLGLGDQVGYGTLVQQVLEHSLEKGHTRADWSRRPLEQEQLRYALDDVIYLGEVYLKLVASLREKGRDRWLEDDFARLADPTTYAVDPDASWQRVKGRQRLKGIQLAVLKALSAWREERAIAANRPRRWIIKDEVLLDLARRMPGEIRQLERIRGLESGTVKHFGETLLERIAEARKIPKEQWPEEKRRSPRLSINQEAMADLLMCSLRLLAAEEGITPSALASQGDIERLIHGERDLAILDGWRKLIAGDALLEVLAGRRAPRVEEGKIYLGRAHRGEP